MAELWSTKERKAWAWPDTILPSEWAERNRILPPNVTAEPGPWRGDRTPYIAGICDSMCEPGVEEIVVLKAAQVAFSEMIRNILGYCIDHDPGPALCVMPDQKSAEELIEERIKPLLEYTPAVTRHLTSRAWDVKKGSIRLDTMSIYIGWAGSSQALKSRPIRWLFLDEPDEYPAVSGAGGDPISKAMKRITTFSAKGRARVLIGGTPTSRLGNIWKRFESCGDKRYRYVPCPHCGVYQKLVWAQVKYAPAADGETREQHAERIQATGDAWYECEKCGGKITESVRMDMIRRGQWVGTDQVITPDGRVTGPILRHRRIGFHIPAMYSPWVTLAKLAAEWLEAQTDVQMLCDFVNERLAEPFEEQRSKSEPGFFRDKANGSPPPLVVPKWAEQLIATADTQGTDERDGYFWYVIRAWGFNYRSQLIDYGVCSSKEELVTRCLDRGLAMEPSGQVVCQLLVIDSGGPRWSEVYQMAQADNRVRAAKGLSNRKTWMLTERPQKQHDIVLWEIDTEQAKDLLHRLAHDPDKTKWLVHNQINDDYCRQMTAEWKIFDPVSGTEKWVEIIKNANHLWDCEATQCAVAWRLGMGAPDPVPTVVTSASSSSQQPRNWITGWKGKY